MKLRRFGVSQKTRLGSTWEATAGFPALLSCSRRVQKNLVQLDAKLVAVEQLLREIEAGGPVAADSDNIDRFNSMQVVYAERYLASASGYFDLAKRMLVERPELRQGGVRGDLKFK
jgi:hypothetical protein